MKRASAIWCFSAQKVPVDRTEPVPGANPTPPFNVRQAAGRFISKCHEVASGSIGAMTGAWARGCCARCQVLARKPALQQCKSTSFGGQR